MLRRDRLQMVRDRIAAEPPKALKMDRWHCGTSHCIGGWADVLMGTPEAIQKRDPWLAGPRAREWLGLSSSQSGILFSPWEEDETNYIDVFLPNASQITKADALAALDSLINAESDDALPVWPVKAEAA